jgi:hypothetical protein
VFVIEDRLRTAGGVKEFQLTRCPLQRADGSVENSHPPSSRDTSLHFANLVPNFTPWIQAQRPEKVRKPEADR